MTLPARAKDTTVTLEEAGCDGDLNSGGPPRTLQNLRLRLDEPMSLAARKILADSGARADRLFQPSPLSPASVPDLENEILNRSEANSSEDLLPKAAQTLGATVEARAWEFTIKPNQPADAETQTRALEHFTAMLAAAQKQTTRDLSPTDQAYLSNNLVVRAAACLVAQGVHFKIQKFTEQDFPAPLLQIEFVGSQTSTNRRLARFAELYKIKFYYYPLELLRTEAEAIFIDYFERVDLPHDYIKLVSIDNFALLHEIRHAAYRARGRFGHQRDVQTGDSRASGTATLPGRWMGSNGFYRAYMGHDEPDDYVFTLKNGLNMVNRPGVVVSDARLFGFMSIGLETSARNLLLFRGLSTKMKAPSEWVFEGHQIARLLNGVDKFTIRRNRAWLEVEAEIAVNGGTQSTEFRVYTGEETATVDMLAAVRSELKRRIRMNQQRIYQFQLAIRAWDKLILVKSDFERRILRLALNRSLRYQLTSYRHPDFTIEGPADLVARFNHELELARAREAPR